MVSLGRRFFLLTAGGFIAALASCVVIVWTLAAPFLSNAQKNSLEEIARQQANTASLILDELFDRAEYLARSPIILDLVNGTQDNLAAVSDHINAFATPSLRVALILDYEGAILFSFDPNPSMQSRFSEAEFREGFSEIQFVAPGSNRPGRLSLRREGADDINHLLISVPIWVAGAVEGAVVMEKVPDFSALRSGGWEVVTEFQLQLMSETETPIFAPVPGQPLFVVLRGSTDEMTAGRSEAFDLVARISLGLSLVLLAPFLAMSVFGAKHLVAPTQALERSRERLQAQQHLLKKQSVELSELAAISQLSSDSIMVTDTEGHIEWVNKAFTEMTGYTEHEVRGRFPQDVLCGPETDPDTLEGLRMARQTGTAARFEILNYRKTKEPFWSALSLSPLQDDTGKVTRYASVSSDITEQRKAVEAVAKAHRETEYQSLHDPLTGLPNRRFLDGVLERDVTATAEKRTLIRVDLDFFKNVNDTHGHAAGDHVLKVVSEILTGNCRPMDLVARVGGDEFVVLLEHGGTTSEANDMCQRFRMEICKDIEFEGKTCRVGASFGVASALDGLVGNNELLVGADAALYLSKAKGRNTTTLYTPEVHTDVLNKRRSATEIEHAIANREFEPYFQPQVDAKTRQFAGLEALARWQHPVQGTLAPAAFLPLAAQLSLVPEIDDIIYEKALVSITSLKQKGFEVPKISFNVGAQQLENSFLRSIHQRFDLGETAVAFEVLESVLVEEQDTSFAFQIDLLRDMGFLIEVDDFGSGHASVVGLMQLRPDAMKLDQRLVMPLGEDPAATITVNALVDIGRSQGIKITAEGVETEEHAHILAELGVDTLQGYHFSQPLPIDKLPDFLEDLRRKAAA